MARFPLRLDLRYRIQLSYSFFRDPVKALASAPEEYPPVLRPKYPRWGKIAFPKYFAEFYRNSPGGRYLFQLFL